MTNPTFDPQDPLSAALGDNLHQHRLRAAQDDAADALGLSVRDALREALRPLLPRMLPLRIAGNSDRTIASCQWYDDKAIDTLTAKLLGSTDRGQVIALQLGNQRSLTLNVPTVASRRYRNDLPHIALVENSGDRNYAPRSQPAQIIFELDTPPSQVIAQFCRMFALHVDYATLAKESA